MVLNAKVLPECWLVLYKSNAYVAGREAMVCCSDDTSLIGLWVYTKQLKPKALSWIHLYGRIRVEFDEDYGGEVWVIDEIERTELQEHEDDYVYFT